MSADAPLPRRKNSDVLHEMLDLDGAQVLDVGCGAGHLSRLMSRHGARVIGLEVSDRQLERAAQYDTVGTETYLKAPAEALPVDAASQDVVVFFNSLHHVAPKAMDAALAEAARALRPDGRLFVCEPMAEGACYELNRPIDDEAEVRALARQALDRLGAPSWRLLSRRQYLHSVRYKDYPTYRTDMTGIDAGRAATFERLGSDQETAFQRLGRVDPEDGSHHFDQPMEVHLFARLGAPGTK
ncbi:class I SAM-dependent methyltransferase [Roseospirillum parvum]|uniref:Methyltransferase type 11 domain-containing protein n=1 Tax=Roseospirillum parvum TaxID=83401 RepID=A0A1G8AT88_9PROT|nr:class I SAM-dependent methyltransferase [Roseospirillum parvum]SDH23530.1 hypothetical protein SAMN05421742_10583 [Roseospirillum parvum]